MTAYGPFFPSGVVSDNVDGGKPWANPGNAAADDTAYAQPGGNGWLSSGVKTEFLKATFASLAAPSGADVSVTFRVKRHKAGVAIRDQAARLVLAGAIQSSNFASSANWPASDEVAEYVFTGLTPEQVNSGSFGFALAAKNPGVPTGTPYVQVIEAVATW